MKRKILSLVLALVLVLALLPASTLQVSAASTVTCNSFAQFKAAMEDPTVDTVKLGSFIETVSQNGLSAITVRTNSGTKNLVLDGSANIWTANKNSGYRYLIEVAAGVQLVVSGSGTLAGSPAYADGNNALFCLNGGELCFAQSFTGTVTADAKHDNTCGAAIFVKAGNLLIEGGNFFVYNGCTKNACTVDHGVVTTDTSDNEDTYVVLLGGYYSMFTFGVSSVIAGNAHNIFVNNIRYYANSVSDSYYAQSNIISNSEHAAWNPYRKHQEPNFVIADLGETGKIVYELAYSASNGFCSMENVNGVNLYEVVGKNRVKVGSKSYANEKRTFYIDGSDTPTVKYYIIEVEYAYTFGGRTICFTAEQELRAEWMDLSYRGIGTKEDPVKVATFPELRRAMRDKNIEYVQVVSDIDYTLNYDAYRHDGSNSVYYRVKDYHLGLESAESIYNYLAGLDITDGYYVDAERILGRALNCSALQVLGKKHLILTGNVTLTPSSFPFTADESGFQYGITINSDLTISGGNAFAVNLTSAAMGPDAAAICADTGAELIIEDAKILAKSLNGTGYAHAICVSNDGTLIIHDGEFRGQRATGDDDYNRGFYTGAVRVADAYAQINGGTFGELNFGEEGTDSVAGLIIDEKYLHQATISGGNFETGLMKERDGHGYQLTDADWETVLAMGATYTANTFNKNGVEITSVTVTSPEKVRTVALTVREPKEGDRPSYTFAVDGIGYSVMGNTYNYTDYRQWMESTGNGSWRVMATTDTFKAGYYYKAYVDIKAKNGYMFSVYDNGISIVPDITATVNGKDARVIKTYEQDPSGYVTLEIEFGRCSERIIKQVEIEGVTEPVSGAHPTYAGTVGGTGYMLEPGESRDRWDNRLYKSNGMVWYDENWNILYADDTFQAGKTYYLMAYLDISDTDTYQFDWNDDLPWGTTNVRGYINGREVEVQPESSNTIWNHRLVATFVCTGPAWIVGDMDGNGRLSTDDAVYLLLNVLFGDEEYPLPAGANKDIDGNGAVSTDDAVYLLLHVMFGQEEYPI